MKPSERFFAVAAVVCSALSCSHAQDASAAEPILSIRVTNNAELAANIGKRIVVNGIVASAAKGANDGSRFLNFGDDKTGLSAVISPAVYPDLQPLEEYEGKQVHVTGELAASQDKMQINVECISQIKVAESTVDIELLNLPIDILAVLYDDLTFKPVICDPSVGDGPKVLIDTGGMISRVQAIALIEMSLKARGYTLTPLDDGGVKISYGTRAP